MEIINIEHVDGSARAGTLRTSHGNILTPAFMPVGTQASVKSLDPRDLKEVGTQIVLANNYHLYLRPGVQTIEDLGGLHNFMNWHEPILTDSGGFQGYSLQHLRKITKDAIIFKSHIDGSNHVFTPEAAIKYQEKLGADIIMPLDLCVSSDSSQTEVQDAMQQTHKWLDRSIHAKKDSRQILFGIVQGGMFSDLRKQSADYVSSLNLPGYAIGGLSVGESKSKMYEIVSLTVPYLPDNAPRYLMGVGSPEDLVECVNMGIDLFDCVLPTRIARNSALFAPEGRINISTAKFKTWNRPVQEDCDCYTCENFTAAYLHHLFRTKELLAFRLASIHNLRFIMNLMQNMRESIKNHTFERYRQEFHSRFNPPNEQIRKDQKQKWLQSLKRK